MRTGTRRRDGTVALSKIEEGSVDMRRYLLVRDHGMSIVEIAKMDGVPPARIQESIKRGRGMYEAEQQIAYRDAKYESAIENEKFRKKLRQRIDTKLEEAIETLLTGRKIVVGIDPKTGEINTQEITDPETIALGVEAASKILALNEKPASTQVAINMNTQINNNGDGPRGGELTYEDMIDRISERQRGDRIPKSRQIIEAEATEVAEEGEPF
jgi:hypothetical protein